MKTLLIIIALTTILACQKKVEMQTRGGQDCTAQISQYNEIIVTCPDGTELILPPEVNTVTEIVEVPVYVNVPSECKKPKKRHNHGNKKWRHGHGK